MAEHTKTPWEVSRFCGKPCIQGNRTKGREGEPDSVVVLAYLEANATSGEIPDANARRIVACVNALAGIPTEELERIAAIASDDKRFRSISDAAVEKTSDRPFFRAGLGLY